MKNAMRLNLKNSLFAVTRPWGKKQGRSVGKKFFLPRFMYIWFLPIFLKVSQFLPGKFSSYLDFTKKRNKNKMRFYKKFKMKLDFFVYELLSKAHLPVAQLASISYPMAWPEKKHLLLGLV